MNFPFPRTSVGFLFFHRVVHSFSFLNRYTFEAPQQQLVEVTKTNTYNMIPTEHPKLDFWPLSSLLLTEQSS